MDPSRAPIDSLQVEMGKALDLAIDKQGGKVAFARKAGLNRATLYRLLRGENVSTEVLLRALRALGRIDLLSQLIEPPSPSPLELRPPIKRKQSPIPSTGPKGHERSLVRDLELGRLPFRSDDG